VEQRPFVVPVERFRHAGPRPGIPSRDGSLNVGSRAYTTTIEQDLVLSRGDLLVVRDAAFKRLLAKA
jgi:hypothetical protein